MEANKIMYEDLKCEFCDGHGEREVNIDGADCECECGFCDNDGIDHFELEKLIATQKAELVSEIEKLIMHAEQNTLGYSVLEHARKLVFTYSQKVK